MATIEVDIDIEDYLYKVSDADLIAELESRGIDCHTDDPYDITYAKRDDFDDDRAVREFLFEFMDVQPWKGRRDLLAAIDELFDL
jgi:hypothetical protein